jgi:hypothetical protein
MQRQSSYQPQKGSNIEKEKAAPDADLATRYCRCLMKVRPTLKPPYLNPYGICHRSVLKGLCEAPKACTYKFSDFTTNQLLAYALELQGRAKWNFVMDDAARHGDRKRLLVFLTNAQRTMKNHVIKEKSQR